MTVETFQKIAFLKKIHLFHGLEDNDLASIAMELEEIPYPAGSVIFEQGSKPESFYFIYEGTVRIVRKQDHKEIQLARLVKNDYFGEMGLIGKRPRSGTAVALTDTILLVLPRLDFEKLYKRTSQLQMNFDLAIRSRQLARSLQFKWLRPDEVIYFLARKHRIVLYQKLIWPFFALFLPIVFVYAWFTIAPSIVVLIAAVVSLLAVVLWVIWLVVDWGNDYYIVTDQRVVWLEKVVGIYDSRQESPLSTVLSVGVETHALGRILDFGDVIVRTWVGRIPFDDVSHPEQARHMIEEYWQRTKEQFVGLEKEAMKNAIRKRLGIPVPAAKAISDTLASQPAAPSPAKKRVNWLRMLGADTLKLRYETGESVYYRKHWVVLIQQAAVPLLGILAALIVFIWRQVRLFQLPNEALLGIVNGSLGMDAYSLAILIALVPLLAWLVYELIDWSNDQFQVTTEHIIDLDKKPFGTQTRNAAQLENILGTEYKRIGVLGEIFNYGTVYITVGGSKMAFEDVIDPATVQSDIDRRRMARKAKQDEARITAERERMAEWLATYHRSAEEFRTEEEEKKNQKPG